MTMSHAFLAPHDRTDIESIPLGYSASTLGTGDKWDVASVIKGKPSALEYNSYNQTQGLNSSVFSLSSMPNPTKPPVVLDKWYLQPVKGSGAIKVCGTKVSDGSLHKSTAIQIRVNRRSVLTVKGTMYHLVGPIQHAKNMPVWFEEKFFDGFPQLWKSKVDDYLEWLGQQNSDDDSDDNVVVNSSDTPRLKDVNIKLTLYRWVIVVCGKHLLVEGFAVGPEDKPQLYRTNPVVDAIDSTVIYTTSRSYYRLVGPINVEATVQGGVSLWFAKRFKDGFPKNWRELVEVYLNYISTSEESSKQSKPSDALEMMSLLSCEGFATKKRYTGPWPSKSALFSDENTNNESFEKTLDSIDVNVPDTLVKKPKKKSRKSITKANILLETSSAEISVDSHLQKKPKRKYRKAVSTVKKPTVKTKPVHDSPSAAKRSRSEKKRRSLKTIDTNTNSNVRNSKTVSVKKKSVSSTKKAFKSPSSNLAVPSFCTPPTGKGLYKTKSGRHVFPLLQHWTFQRLTTECDDEGNEVVVFHPGQESVLKDSSPACEYLRNAEWVHRQFQEDQLMHSPLPNHCKQVKMIKRKARPSSCVKNIFDESTISVSSTEDILSELICHTDSNTYVAEVYDACATAVCNGKALFETPDNTLLKSKNQSSMINQSNKLANTSSHKIDNNSSRNHEIDNNLVQSQDKNEVDAETTRSQLVSPQTDGSAAVQTSHKTTRVTVAIEKSSPRPQKSIALDTSNNEILEIIDRCASKKAANHEAKEHKKKPARKTPAVKVKTVSKNATIKEETLSKSPLGQAQAIRPTNRYNLRTRTKSTNERFLDLVFTPKQVKVRRISSVKKTKKSLKKTKPLQLFGDPHLTPRVKLERLRRRSKTEKVPEPANDESKKQAKTVSKQKPKKQTSNTHAAKSQTGNPGKNAGKRPKKAASRAATAKSIKVDIEPLKNDAEKMPEKKQAKRSRRKAVPRMHLSEQPEAQIEQLEGKISDYETGTALSVEQLSIKRTKKKSLKRRKKTLQTNSSPAIDIAATEDKPKDANKASGESKQSLPNITATKGTLKHRKQTKDLINVLNQPKETQKFDPCQTNENANIFQSNLFTLNSSRDYFTPFTPVSKLPGDFSEEHIKTPAWFQTPISTGDHSCSALTPAYLKEALGDDKFSQTSEIADKCIVQMQKDHKKRKKIRPVKVDAKKKKVVIPNDLFHIKIDEPRHSSDDDDYFSS